MVFLSHKKMIVAIEGNIASGKSTFLEILKKRYAGNAQVSFLDEPVELWENIKDRYGVSMLQKYYSNPAKYAFSFQMMALGSRLHILKQKMDSLDPTIPHVIITERSVFTDRDVFAKMLYDEKMIEDVEFQIYNKWFEDFVAFKVDKIVMLKTSPVVSFERVHVRGRVGEVIPIEYLEKCDRYHEIMLSRTLTPVTLFDADNDIYQTPILEKWVEEMDGIIEKML